jgi:hypothetical protein
LKATEVTIQNACGQRKGIYSQWQPEYAAHRIATFPVHISADNKKPAVKHYGRMGLVASARLVPRFADATALGFMLGKRNGVTVLDVDTPKESVLADALTRHGPTPLIIRSGSGNYQAWYRHNGERRKVRPWRGLPIDLLGAGYIVAPPSKALRGSYEIIQGSLDDLDRLPTLRAVSEAQRTASSFGASEGERNKTLFNHCMRHARHVENRDELLDVGRTFGDNCIPPMEDAEVIRTVNSAWGYQERGDNWHGRGGTVPMSLPMMSRVSDLGDASASHLFMVLQQYHHDKDEFVVANAMTETLGWGEDRLREARRKLVEARVLRLVKQGGRWKHDPSWYAWEDIDQ